MLSFPANHSTCPGPQNGPSGQGGVRGHHRVGGGPASWHRPSGGPAGGRKHLGEHGASAGVAENTELTVAPGRAGVTGRAAGRRDNGDAAEFWRREGRGAGDQPGSSRAHHRQHSLPPAVCERGRLFCDGSSSSAWPHHFPPATRVSVPGNEGATSYSSFRLEGVSGASPWRWKDAQHAQDATGLVHFDPWSLPCVLS